MNELLFTSLKIFLNKTLVFVVIKYSKYHLSQNTVPSIHRILVSDLFSR